MTSKFKNTWTDGAGNIIKSDERPGEYWWPVINPRRVTGDTYHPYTGNGAWVRAANRLMASHAQSNWQRRNFI